MSRPDMLGSPVAIGEIVAGKYRVERLLGVGAMGAVVSARHTTLDQVVAIKYLVEHRFGTREQSIGRFLAEARAAARIGSDHVCRVFDVGTLRDGAPFMVMEYLEGHDLEDELHARGQVGVVEAVDYVLHATDAIAAAHQLGVVHRDLKPANLFLAERPDGSRRVKVLDFGVSQVSIGVPESTHEAATLGTPAYMSPEQIRVPMSVDARADLWALGAILYEMLTGQTPFVGDTVDAMLDSVLASEPCPIRALRRDVPAELEAIVMRCLERDRDHRWGSAAQLAGALAPFGSIGVMSQLACVQRELGSVGSLRPAPVPSFGPMVATVGHGDSHHGVGPDVLRARGEIVHDWTNMQARRRLARAALLGIGSAALIAASVAIVLRASPSRAPTADVAPAAPVMAADPPYASSPSSPSPSPSSSAEAWVVRDGGAMLPPAIAATSVYSASSNARPSANATPPAVGSRPKVAPHTGPRASDDKSFGGRD